MEETWQWRAVKLGLPAAAALFVVSMLTKPTAPEPQASGISGPIEMHADSGKDVVYKHDPLADANAEKNEVSQFNVARLTVDAIKSSMRDPDSLRIDSIRVSEDANTVCVGFGARNGFGGMNREHVVYHGGLGTRSASTWNRRCLGSMHDMTFAAP